MPSAKSSRVDVRRQTRNQPLKTKAKSYVRKAKNLLESGESGGVDQAVVQALTALDKAAVKGAIHPNNAARRKSRLMRIVNKAESDKGQS